MNYILTKLCGNSTYLTIETGVLYVNYVHNMLIRKLRLMVSLKILADDFMKLS